MSLENTTSKVTANGNGVANVFSFSPIVIFSPREAGVHDLVVTKVVIATEAETILTEGTGASNYSVSVASYPGAGSITFPATGATRLAVGEKIVIKRKVALKQYATLGNQGAYLAATQEEMHNRHTMVDLQQQEELDRAVKVPIGSTDTPEDLLQTLSDDAASAQAASVTAVAAQAAAEMARDEAEAAAATLPVASAPNSLSFPRVNAAGDGWEYETAAEVAAAVQPFIGGGTATITAGENLSIRNLVYQDIFNQRGGGADRWYQVDTDAVSPVRISPRIGIALAAISSGATGSVQVRPGRVSGFSGLTAGQAVYTHTTAGGLTQTAPAIPATATQNASRLIGYAASATEIDFDPEDDTIFTGRNSAVAVDGTITVQHWPDTGAREREQAAYLVQVVANALVPGATGTNIGDFTGNGGLAGIFDGITNQDNSGSGFKSTATFGFAGKTYSPGKRVAQAVVWGSNNFGYVASSNPTVTLVLRGKTGTAPANRTDGTSLGSLAFTDTGNESGNPRTIASSDTVTVWDHVWIDFSHAAAADNCFIAEIQITEALPARDEPLTIGSPTVNSTATDRVNVRYDDGAGANADTRTTFINRTNATRDLAGEVVL